MRQSTLRTPLRLLDRLALLSALAALLTSTAAAAHGDKQKKHAHPPAAEQAPAAAQGQGHAHGADDHDHPSPHGGVVVTVDKDHHAEVVFGERALQVWFYDADLKPLPPPSSARATIVVDKKPQKLELVVAKDDKGQALDHLSGAIVLPPVGAVTAVVQATVGGKPKSVRVERVAPKTP